MKFNTFSLFLAILLAFATIGQAETSAEKHQKKIDKLQQKLEKERAKRAERAEENQIKGQIFRERSTEEQPRLKAMFALSCPLGGYDDVVIRPALAREFEYWNNRSIRQFLFHRYTMVHRAKNPYTNMTINITNGGEKVVSNMCPGGSITLVQSMPPFNGGYYMHVVWTAEGIVNGRLAYGDSSPGTLYQGYFNAEAIAKRPTWVMNLARVDRKF
jgi:hypothetical protein